MTPQWSCLHYRPLLTIFLQDTPEAVSLKDEQAALRGHSEDISSQQDGISASVDVESMRLVVLPLPVDVLGVCQVDQCGALHAILLPVRDMEGEVVINDHSHAVSLRSLKQPLVLAVTV